MAELNAKDVPTPVQVGTRIRQALEETGRSAEWLCGETGLSLSTLNRFMGGETNPNVIQVYRIAVATKKPLSWFALVDEDRAERLALSADQFEKRGRQIQADVEWFLGELRNAIASSAAKSGVVPANETKPEFTGGRRSVAQRKRAEKHDKPVAPPGDAAGGVA